MSASEKLRALTAHDYLGPDSDDMNGEAWGELTDTDSLVAALPQIVAVVEAAEAVKFWQREPWTPEFKSIESSLAALEEALS